MSRLADNIIDLHSKGMSDEEIMETLGCSHAFIKQALGEEKKPTNNTIWDERRIRLWETWTNVVRTAFERGAKVPQCYIEVGIRLGIRDKNGKLFVE